MQNMCCALRERMSPVGVGSPGARTIVGIPEADSDDWPHLEVVVLCVCGPGFLGLSSVAPRRQKPGRQANSSPAMDCPWLLGSNR